MLHERQMKTVRKNINEYIRSAGRPTHMWHEWEPFTELLLSDVALAKELGGYYAKVHKTIPTRPCYSRA